MGVWRITYLERDPYCRLALLRLCIDDSIGDIRSVTRDIRECGRAHLQICVQTLQLVVPYVVKIELEQRTKASPQRWMIELSRVNEIKESHRQLLEKVALSTACGRLESAVATANRRRRAHSHGEFGCLGEGRQS